MDKLFVFLTTSTGMVAYGAVFAVLVACGVGLPLPEDIPLVAAGYLSWQGTMQLVPAFFVSLAGVLIGDSIIYVIGRHIGPRVFEHKTILRFYKRERLEKARQRFAKYGDKTVFFGRFVAGIRAVVFFMAGALGMSYPRFILWDGIAAVLSIPIWIGLGYWAGHQFGNEIEELLLKIKEFKVYFAMGVGALLVAMIAYLAFKYWRASHARGNGDNDTNGDHTSPPPGSVKNAIAPTSPGKSEIAI
jgi:membrane protein DedA with SNARE-associated domain